MKKIIDSILNFLPTTNVRLYTDVVIHISKCHENDKSFSYSTQTLHQASTSLQNHLAHGDSKIVLRRRQGLKKEYGMFSNIEIHEIESTIV